MIILYSLNVFLASVKGVCANIEAFGELLNRIIYGTSPQNTQPIAGYARYMRRYLTSNVGM